MSGHSILLNDTSRFNLEGTVEQINTTISGADVKAIQFTIHAPNSDVVKAKFSSKYNTSLIRLYNKDGIITKTYENYDTLKTIGKDEILSTDDNQVFMVVMVKSNSFNDRLTRLETKYDTVIEDLEKIKNDNDPDKMSIDKLRMYLINLSKLNFANYLEEHPVRSNAHGNVYKFYTCTQEKQSLLMAAVAVAQLHQLVGDSSYKASWNANEEPCTYDWTLQELAMLSIHIEAFVHPLLSAQQCMEVLLRKAVNREELLSVPITFPPDKKITDIVANEIAQGTAMTLAASQQPPNSNPVVENASHNTTRENSQTTSE